MSGCGGCGVAAPADKVKVQAVLTEIMGALQYYQLNKQSYTIYLANTGLTQAEQILLVDTLGKGDINIEYHETTQPCNWYETTYRGVWVGVFRDQTDNVILQTVEVAEFPQLAASQALDMQQSVVQLQHHIQNFNS